MVEVFDLGEDCSLPRDPRFRTIYRVEVFQRHKAGSGDQAIARWRLRPVVRNFMRTRGLSHDLLARLSRDFAVSSDAIAGLWLTFSGTCVGYLTRQAGREAARSGIALGTYILSCTSSLRHARLLYPAKELMS